MTETQRKLSNSDRIPLQLIRLVNAVQRILFAMRMSIIKENKYKYNVQTLL